MILDAGYLTYYRKTEWKCYESKKPLIGRQKAVFWIIKDGLLHSKRAHVTALIPTYGYVFCAKNYLFWQIFDFNIHDVEKKKKKQLYLQTRTKPYIDITYTESRTVPNHIKSLITKLYQQHGWMYQTKCVHAYSNLLKSITNL